MKACAFENQAQQWHDGELPYENQAALFHHLAECEQCRRLLHDLKNIRQWAQQAQLDFPEDLDRPLFQVWSSQRADPVSSTATKPFWKRRIALPAPLIAAMLLLIVVSIFSFGRFWEQQQRHQTMDNSHDLISSLTFAMPDIEIWSDRPAQHLQNQTKASWDDHVTAVFQSPRPLDPVVPAYPDMARQFGLEGEVTLLAQVDAVGEVSQIKVAQNQAAGEGFVEKARAALQHTRFQPGRQNGRAASCRIMVRYVFHNQTPSATQEFIEQFI
jgi:TonB family protein